MAIHSFLYLGGTAWYKGFPVGMKIENILTERKADIVKKWIDLVLDSYESANFFKSQKNAIANPIGSNISEGLKELFDLLLKGSAPEHLAPFLETIIKIRAVQDFTPSQAVSFVLLLKKVVRDELASADKGGVGFVEAMELEERIDQAALQAFDIYMSCRERLFQIRLNEYRNGTHALTDGTKCGSAWLRRKMEESAANNQINSST